ADVSGTGVGFGSLKASDIAVTGLGSGATGMQAIRAGGPSGVGSAEPGFFKAVGNFDGGGSGGQGAVFSGMAMPSMGMAAGMSGQFTATSTGSSTWSVQDAGLGGRGGFGGGDGQFGGGGFGGQGSMVPGMGSTADDTQLRTD